MNRAFASIILSALLTGCSDSNESPTSPTPVTVNPPQKTNINYTFSFSQYHKDIASEPEVVDSVLLTFAYTDHSGSVVRKSTTYIYSKTSPAFTDLFSVYENFGTGIPPITVTEMTGFNNRIGIREERWTGPRTDPVSNSNGKLLVPVMEMSTASYAKGYITSIAAIKNGTTAFNLDSDTLYVDDTVELTINGTTTNGKFDFDILTYVGQDDKVSIPYNWKSISSAAAYNDVFTAQKTITNNSFSIKAKIGWSNQYYSQKRKFIFAMTPMRLVYEPSCDTTIALMIGIGKSKMISIKGGSFKQKIELQLPSGKFDTSRLVTLTDFQISKYPVTLGEYKKVMNSVYSSDMQDHRFHSISWVDAAKFCNKKSILDGYEIAYDSITWKLDITKNGYHLPTDAQWEYAARAGTTTKYWWGSVSDNTLESIGLAGDGILNGFGVGGYYFSEMTTDAEPVHSNAGDVKNPTYPYVSKSRMTTRINDSESRHYTLSASDYFRVARF